MFYLMVLNNVVGPINMLVCSTCMLLMFFEAAFGICLGCKLYNLFFSEKAKLCPGDACEANTRHAIQNIGMAQVASLVVFLGLIDVVGQQLHRTTPTTIAQQAAATDECTPPDWAVKMSHAEMWKQHHNCQ